MESGAKVSFHGDLSESPQGKLLIRVSLGREQSELNQGEGEISRGLKPLTPVLLDQTTSMTSKKSYGEDAMITLKSEIETC